MEEAIDIPVIRSPKHLFVGRSDLARPIRTGNEDSEMRKPYLYFLALFG